MDYQYYKRLFISIAGIYIVYLNYGLVQERIYRYQSSDGSRFKYTSLLLVIQCTINLIIATLGESFFGKKQVFDYNTPRKDLIGRKVVTRTHGNYETCIIKDIVDDGDVNRISFTLQNGDIFERVLRETDEIYYAKDNLSNYKIYGICYTLAMIFSNSALRHVNYPTQVLGKSCKMIPVLLAGTIFGTRKYSIRKYISVFIITGGIVCNILFLISLIVFQMMSSKKKVSQESNSMFGLILLFLSLCCDGVCGMQQDVVVPLFKPSPLHLQQMLNIWGVGVSLVTALLTGDFLPGLSFLMNNKLCLWYAVQFGLCSSIGQLFILYTVRHFPPLVLSTITTARKFFSILISVLFMGNDINGYQWMGVFLVFFGIFFDKVQGNKEKSHGN